MINRQTLSPSLERIVNMRSNVTVTMRSFAFHAIVATSACSVVSQIHPTKVFTAKMAFHDAAAEIQRQELVCQCLIEPTVVGAGHDNGCEDNATAQNMAVLEN